jgi:hypothetical protein
MTDEAFQAAEEVFKQDMPGGLSPFVIARIRTGIPTLVGVLLAWVQHQFSIAVTLDPGVTGLLVLAISGVWYELVRRLEAWKPSLGWLLGYPATPTY